MRALFVACALPHRSFLQLHHKLLFTPKLAVVLLEFLTPQTILRQVIPAELFYGRRVSRQRGA